LLNAELTDYRYATCRLYALPLPSPLIPADDNWCDRASIPAGRTSTRLRTASLTTGWRARRRLPARCHLRYGTAAAFGCRAPPYRCRCAACDQHFAAAYLLPPAAAYRRKRTALERVDVRAAGTLVTLIQAAPHAQVSNRRLWKIYLLLPGRQCHYLLLQVIPEIFVIAINSTILLAAYYA